MQTRIASRFPVLLIAFTTLLLAATTFIFAQTDKGPLTNVRPPADNRGDEKLIAVKIETGIVTGQLEDSQLSPMARDEVKHLRLDPSRRDVRIVSVDSKALLRRTFSIELPSSKIYLTQRSRLRITTLDRLVWVGVIHNGGLCGFKRSGGAVSGFLRTSDETLVFTSLGDGVSAITSVDISEVPRDETVALDELSKDLDSWTNAKSSSAAPGVLSLFPVPPPNGFELAVDQAMVFDRIIAETTTVDIRIATVAPGLRDAQTIELLVSRDHSIRGLRTQTNDVDSLKYNWIGTADSGGSIVLAVNGTNVTGTIRAGHELFAVHPLGTGTHAIVRMEEQAFPTERQPPERR